MHQLSVSAPMLSVLYFVLLVVFGAFFVLNLYAVVISDSYLDTMESLRDAVARKRLERADAKKLATAKRKLGKQGLTHKCNGALGMVTDAIRGGVGKVVGACISTTRLRCPGVPKLQRLVEHRGFESTMIVAIVANTAVLAIDFYGSSATMGYVRTLQYTNWAFTWLFFLEMLIRIAASGCEYFRGEDWRWNIFDVLLVLLAAFDQLPASAGMLENMSFLRIMRLMKML